MDGYEIGQQSNAIFQIFTTKCYVQKLKSLFIRFVFYFWCGGGYTDRMYLPGKFFIFIFEAIMLFLILSTHIT